MAGVAVDNSEELVSLSLLPPSLRALCFDLPACAGVDGGAGRRWGVAWANVADPTYGFGLAVGFRQCGPIPALRMLTKLSVAVSSICEWGVAPGVTGRSHSCAPSAIRGDRHITCVRLASLRQRTSEIQVPCDQAARVRTQARFEVRETKACSPAGQSSAWPKYSVAWPLPALAPPHRRKRLPQV
jgi:hypothetical protein